MNRFLLTPYFLDDRVPELENVADATWRMNDPLLPDGDLQRRLTAIHRPIADFVTETLQLGDRPVCFNGDCCATIGVLAGIQHAGHDPILLWLDAHGDFNTWETTPSEFLGGMPLAMIVGRGEQTMVDRVGLMNLPEAGVVLCDARDLDPGEREALLASQVNIVPTIDDLLDYDFDGRPIYVHFDSDLINAEAMPASKYKAANGPHPEKLYQLFRHLRENENIMAVSLTAWAPELDEDGRSAYAVMDLFWELIHARTDSAESST